LMGGAEEAFGGFCRCTGRRIKCVNGLVEEVVVLEEFWGMETWWLMSLLIVNR